ncbi:hypothetical protein HD554DRAFT_2329403 [Boletus coccyginus]|nr:hypothetical protein HD554DRAFT_2329403 [Boletus coccyginus]
MSSKLIRGHRPLSDPEAPEYIWLVYTSLLAHVLIISPAFVVWFFPGSKWFYDRLILTGSAPSWALDTRTDNSDVAARQLYHSHPATRADVLIRFNFKGYMLVAFTSSFAFRAIRDTLPNDPGAQERIVYASLTALCFADTFPWADHDAVRWATSWVGLPEKVRYSFGRGTRRLMETSRFAFFFSS